jgi:hypothetical protein
MRRWPIVLAFALGLALGIAAAVLGPRLAGRYLPGVFRGKAEPVPGVVVEKQREQDRLLLTLVSDGGAILASFRKKVAEISLLVEKGDRVTLVLHGYQPFVDDPRIERVEKRKPEGPAEGGGSASQPTGDQGAKAGAGR